MTQNKPTYIEWASIGLCGVAGKAGSGKSSTMRLLAAQMAMSGTGLLIADGHGRFGQQSLGATLQPLAASFILPVAVDDADILNVVTMAHKVAQWRMKHWTDSKEPPRIALIIDELANILMRFDKETAQYVINALNYFATEARKTNVKTFIAAQNWTQDFIGAASIRKNMNTVILHRTAADEVAKFTNLSMIKKTAPNMHVGEAWIISQLDPVKVRIPRVTQDDLVAITSSIPVYIPSHDVETIVHKKPTVSASQRDISQFRSRDQTQDILQKWYVEIRKLNKEGYTKTQVIQQIWNVSPGSSKRYKLASKIYDSIKAKIV